MSLTCMIYMYIARTIGCNPFVHFPVQELKIRKVDSDNLYRGEAEVVPVDSSILFCSNTAESAFPFQDIICTRKIYYGYLKKNLKACDRQRRIFHNVMYVSFTSVYNFDFVFIGFTWRFSCNISEIYVINECNF